MRKNFGVIGNPIAHSLSPLMHNAAFKFYSLDYEYERILIPSEEELTSFIKNSSKEYLGLNVTLPYKNSVIKHLDFVSPEALLAGSVNTIVVEESGKLNGYSTDGYGLEMALKANFNSEPSNTKYLFLGCGGAANSCIVHLLSCGAKNIIIANRTQSKADELVSKLRCVFPFSEIYSCSLHDSDSLKRFIKDDYLIIQSTSLGLKDSDELPLDVSLLTNGARIFDMIYKETKFQKMAKEKGCKCFGGLDMLLHQGAKSFEIWTGLQAPVIIMKNALNLFK
ncbi:MAG: shikimate dehydrogenase [Lentisphaerota bacterium]